MVVSYLLSQCNRGVWLVAVIKSQPEKNSSSVKVADDKSFRQVVADSGREAFILFYSPHCKHCNRLAPVWEELGEKLRGEAIDIVKIDGTTNKLLTSEYGVTRYPTIFWKFANMAKRPVKYDGGRDLQDFIKYVCEHASQELRGWDRKGMPK